jgi:hypothetical protein
MKKTFFCVLLIFFSFLYQNAFAEAREDYLAIFMEGKKVGYAVNTREVLDGKVKTTTQMSITISRGEITLTVKASDSCIETAKGEPLSFDSQQEMSFVKMNVSGTIEPNGTMIVKKGNSIERQKWPEGALLAEGLLLLEREKGLKKGTSYKTTIFNPSSADVIDANIIVGDRQPVDLLGRIVSLTEVKTTMSMPAIGEMVSVSYVDDNFDTQKSIMPVMGMNIEMVACPKEFALSPPEVLDLIDKMIIPSPQPINNISNVESVTYYLSPKPQTNPKTELTVKETIKLETIPSTDNQTVKNAGSGKVVITVKPVQMPKGVKLPYSGSDKKALEALKPTRYVQSDNEKIISLSKKAVGNSTDATEAARKIEEFVSKYVENKSLSVGYASAVEVADSKQGDCTEFAVLTAALCRAAGIPAQVVVGIAYVDEWGGFRNSFGGHAWTQVYIDGKWVGLDSAFKSTGRGGFDAGHIALAVGDGDPEDFFRLVSTFGLFKIDKLEVTTRK